MGNSGTNRGRSNHVHLDVELLSAYIDNEVTLQEAVRVERHLQVCGSCAEELASLRWTVNLLREVPPVAVPRSFAIRQIDLEPEPARRPFALPDWLFNGLQWATVATAVLAILVFAGDILNVFGQPAAAPAVMMAPLSERGTPIVTPEARLSEAEKEAAPAVPTVVTKRDESAELAGGPSEVPAMPAETAAAQAAPPQPRGQPSTNQPETEAIQEAAPQAGAQSKVPTEPAEDQAEEPRVSEPTPAPERLDQALPAARSPNRLRLAEIGLTGLFVVLLGLTLWARRRRTA